MYKPTCRKCGQQHYNFLRCAKAEEFNEQQEAKRIRQEQEQTVVPIWRPREGMREWGDRLYSYERHEDTYWRRKD